MIALIPDQAVPVVTGVTTSLGTAGLHAVLLVTFLIVVIEKVVLSAVGGPSPPSASRGLNIGLIPLGIGTAAVFAQAIG